MSTKAIQIADFRHKQRPTQKYLPYVDTDSIRERFEMASYIIDALFVEAESLIKDAGLNPGVFTLTPGSGQKCLATDLNEFFEGGEAAMSLTYTATINDIQYAVVENATIDGDIVNIDGSLVKWEGWGCYEYDNGQWIEGSGLYFPDYSQGTDI